VCERETIPNIVLKTNVPSASNCSSIELPLSLTGKTYLANVLCKKYGIHGVVTVTIGDLAVMYPGDLLKGLAAHLGSIKQSPSAVGRNTWG